MSVSYIPESVKLRLWGKAAGCCQYENCSKPLYLDSLTKAEFNTSYIAHVIADQPKGPRGHPILSDQLKADLNNLMLLCDEHHRLVDKAQVEEHPAERLILMKQKHEERIELLCSLTPDKRSHIILYGANIGVHESPLNFKEAANVILNKRYPASLRAVELGIHNSVHQDHSPEYWKFQEEQLTQMFQQRIASLKGSHEVQHFSVFGLAPMPLLIKLGTLFSDIYPVDVYQRHREPATWEWQTGLKLEENYFQLVQPAAIQKKAVLKIALSATISDDRIFSVMGEDCSIWTISHSAPHNDFLKSEELLKQFRHTVRTTLDKIKASHGQGVSLHIFPAMPVSAAIEMGRVWMPKADLPMTIYDQNNKARSFIKTITIK